MSKTNALGLSLRLNEPSAEQKNKPAHARICGRAVHTLRIEQINLSEEDLASVHLRKEGEHLRCAREIDVLSIKYSQPNIREGYTPTGGSEYHSP